MAFMEWKPEMSVGVPEIDDDHRVLIAVINELAEIQGREDRVSELRGCFSHLKSYAEFHFSREEAMMRTAGFPALDGHQAEHRAFEAKMAELQETLEGDDGKAAVSAVNEKLLSYLKNWLQHHILVIDQAYAPSVQESREALEVAHKFKASHHWWGSS